MKTNAEWLDLLESLAKEYGHTKARLLRDIIYLMQSDPDLKRSIFEKLHEN